MRKTNNGAVLDASAAHFPEHGPIAENGKEILLSVRNVDINFGKGETQVQAVKNGSFDVYKGETFSLVGESGSGKTTIGRAVIRVNPCSRGEILYKGVRISGRIPPLPGPRGHPQHPDGVPGPGLLFERTGYRGLYHLRRAI